MTNTKTPATGDDQPRQPVDLHKEAEVLLELCRSLAQDWLEEATVDQQDPQREPYRYHDFGAAHAYTRIADRLQDILGDFEKLTRLRKELELLQLSYQMTARFYRGKEEKLPDPDKHGDFYALGMATAYTNIADRLQDILGDTDPEEPAHEEQ